mgnify:CR=1 FL=1
MQCRSNFQLGSYRYSAALGAAAASAQQHTRQQHWHSQQAFVPRQQQQQQQQQCWTPPPPPCRWQVHPAVCLAHMDLSSAPPLRSGPPLDMRPNLIVSMHLAQTPRQRSGVRPAVFGQDIVTRLFRANKQQLGDILPWADLHSHTADSKVIQVLVKDTPEARAAAQEAVAAKVLQAGGYAIPLSWGTCSRIPAGCVQVTVHQLPLEYVRTGCVSTLLHAAGQRGEVVAEFLGGSSWSGDAVLSCPAADTVVAWVRHPADDILLCSLPSSFDMQDGSSRRVLINVQGRPATNQHQWLPLNQLYLRHLAAAPRAAAGTGQQAAAEHGGQHSQQRLPSQDVDMEPAPSARDAGPQQLQQQQLQQPQPGSQQQLCNQQQSTPGQSHDDASAMQVDGFAAGLPVEEQPAAAQQEQAWQQQPGQQQSQQQPQQQQAFAANLPHDPFGTQAGEGQWLQECSEHMLYWAVEIAEQEAARELSEQAKQQLQAAFVAEFAGSLQQQECPSDAALMAWLRQQLGVEECGYEDADDDLQPAAAGMDTEQQLTQGAGQQQPQQQQQQPQQQQQQRQQQQQQRQQQQQQRAKQRQGRGKQPQPVLPSRRSARATAGCVSAAYEAVHGVTMGCSRGTARDSSRDQGQGGPGREAPQVDVPQLSTPPAAPPPSRRTGRKVGAA